LKKQAASFMTAALLSSAFSGIAFADTYTVKKGDTLSHIAYSYNTSISELKKVNKLSSDLIYANQRLTVPSLNPTLSTASVKKTTVPAAKTTVQAQTTAAYLVKSGDTLSKIATKHNIKLSDLQKWNGIKGHLIYPGQKLKLTNVTGKQTASVAKPSQPAKSPVKQTPVTQTPVKQPQTPAKPVQASPAQTEYTIKSGDTLSKIGLQYGMSVQQIKELNKLTSDLIFAGQKLVVHRPSDSAVQAPAETPVKQPKKSSEPDVISFAKEMLTVPYLWAGSTPDGFDCSGFIYYAFNKAGKQMGRYSSEGYYNRSFYVNEPQPGDLVFFENTYKKGISHLGIYLGNNEFIHASPTGGVIISNLNESYYVKHFEGFKRFY
jgi:cell wall-associated NlpC family hydrolase